MLEEVRSRHFCSPNSSFPADIKKRAGATEKQCEFSFPTLVAWERNVAKLSPASIGILGSPVPILAGWPIKPLSLPPRNATEGHPGGDSLRSPPSPTIGSPMAAKSFFAMISESDAAQKKLPLPIVFFCASVCPPSSRARQPSMSFHRDPFPRLAVERQLPGNFPCHRITKSGSEQKNT